jgi:hypothetical protein
MNKSRRLIVFLIIFTGVLILGLAFWQYVLDQILTPIALTAWLFLRIFVLSIDQKVYWIVLILGSVIVLFRHLIQYSMSSETETLPEADLALKDIEFWRTFFTLYTHDKKEQFMVKRELVRLLVSMYASKQGVAANFLVMDALKKGEIPLPEAIYSFLFVEDQIQKDRHSLKQILRTLWLAPRHWLDERSGRNIEEYYRMVTEVLDFMESSLEIKNDDERIKLT